MNKFILFFCLVPFLGFNQDFRYQKEINGVQDKWHSINLDKDILSKIKDDFTDIRIYEVTEVKDTLIVPYFIKKPSFGKIRKGLIFTILNQSKIGDDFYITFQAKNDLEINEINLDFKEDNYTYLVDLEGSQDQEEWFGLLEDYRILSIKNKFTDYKFNKLDFPLSLYKYYRVKIKNSDVLNVKSVSIQQVEKAKNEFVENKVNFTSKNTESKTTEIIVDFKNRLPVSKLALTFNEDDDFYRSIKIQYLMDSVKTDNDYYYNFANHTRGYATSYEPSVYNFNTVFTNKLKIIIQNNDNQALKVKNVSVSHINYEAIARFNNNKSTYYLKYGNTKANAPVYDIINFKKDIPENLKTLELSKALDFQNPESSDSIWNKKLWLWLIILVIIALLAYASFRMLKKTS